jgi:hypothetical protein
MRVTAVSSRVRSAWATTAWNWQSSLIARDRSRPHAAAADEPLVGSFRPGGRSPGLARSPDAPLVRALHHGDAEPPPAQRLDEEASAIERRVRLGVARAAQRDQPVQVEVRAPLGSLDHMVDVQPAAPHPAGLAGPFGPVSRPATGSRPIRSHSPRGAPGRGRRPPRSGAERESHPGPPPHDGPASSPRFPWPFCPRGPSSLRSRSSRCSTASGARTRATRMKSTRSGT